MIKLSVGFFALVAVLAMMGTSGCSTKSSTGPGDGGDTLAVYDTTAVFDSTRFHHRVLTLNTTVSGANIADTLTNYPLLVRLSNVADSTGADVLAGAGSDGAKLRFLSADGGAVLKHEIEHWSSTHAAVWVLLPTVTGNGFTSIRMFWGDTVPAGGSNGAAVFDSANGFEAVFHLNEASGDSARDATPNGYKGAPVGSPADSGTLRPVNVTPGSGALIGNAKDFLCDSANINVGSGFRLTTSSGGPTNNSFDYTGTDATFSISAWVKVNAFPATNAFRRGIVTKADSGNGTANTNLQWHMRTINNSNGAFSVLRTSIDPASGGNQVVRPDAAGQWTLVTYSTSAAGGNLRAYNQSGPVTAATSTAANGVHTEANVFIGAFAGASGVGRQFFNGLIDEVRISKVARSNAWHDLDFATQRPGVSALSVGAFNTSIKIDTSVVIDTTLVMQ
jgi:hypothetical protein